MGRSTKIVATLGPASESPACIDELLAAGVDVFRLNLRHGDLDEHLDRLAVIRERSAAGAGDGERAQRANGPSGRERETMSERDTVIRP